MKKFTKKIIIAKLLRWLGITKPISLTEQEVRWIKLLKGHYKKEYPYKGNEWTDVLKPMFEEVYGWSAEDHYHDFLSCMFRKLLDIYLKIKLDQTGCDWQLKEIFNASFSKSISREQELPIERAISQLCGEIQCTTVMENGVRRFYL